MKKTALALFLFFSLLATSPAIYAQNAADVCQGIGEAGQLQACQTCLNNVGHVWTALGCFNAGDPQQAISTVLGWAVVVGFGIAFLIILAASFQMITASGDPKRIKGAQELLTAGIAGLMLIIFSVVLLNLIGVTFLGLPGLEGNTLI